ncbi:shikimate kinase [Streptomyces noursei]|uniref:Shikimate kinase n=1 Tax=Streptomyces noursei TaxID=1971 RepID=A0A059W3U7_STRNR|nr:shikimate kinase [Streptomyces noursei]AIA02466.1 shikimate kinase [Streptomyces noursei]EXU86294.1 shikimate kinase [Streptomyces noursei PD-1]UWS71282.1 shikimate kinase [Streptomyces noursei]GCB90087.1 shikimate kinase [Streptomyces noursei]
MTAPVVVLVGPPGAGKSTVGALLAERLDVGYRDTDADIVATAGKPIAEIFIDEGEPHFRALERAAVRAALDAHPGVLALGGGAIMDDATRQLLTGRPVVFLDVELADAVKRVGLDAPRPLLAVNPRKQWRELMERRRPLYTEVARAVIATGGRTPEDVADAIVDALELRPAANAVRPAGREEQA